MFENYTYESILNSMLENVPAGIDKREGSVIFDALAPAAAELCQYYISLDSVLKETFADTASRQYLILRCRERGITPYQATAAEITARFNKEIEIGERFTAGDVNFYAAERNGDFTYRLICETKGLVGNISSGELFPVRTINGLNEAQIIELTVAGRDEEDTEDLRKRYFHSFDRVAFGGNRADYVNKVKELDGVGDVKVIRVWNGGGTVKLIILGADYGIPSEEVIGEIQERVDPISGEGFGIAPIDHKVTVTAVEGERVNITADITYADGWSYEECSTYINNAIDGYFKELAEKWSESEGVIVRISYIESRLLELQGIEDIANTCLNGVASNLLITDNKIPIRGDINGSGN